MKLLVPGGAGFIGSAFVRLAAAQGHEVTVLDLLTYRGRRENLAGVDHRFIEGDICDERLLDQVVPGADAVVNFANGSFVDLSIREPAEFVRTNVLGTSRLVEAVRRHSTARLLHVSTDEVYGSIDPPGAFSVKHPLEPSSAYSATKAAGDLYALAAHRTHGTPVVIARMCNIFGPRQHPENLIPLFITRLLDGLPVGLYGDGMNVREWMWVMDACEGLFRVLEDGQEGRIYHLGSGVEHQNLYVAERLVDLCGASRDLITFVEDRPGHDRRYRLDTSATQEELGFRASASFEDRLAETVAWFRENRSWWEPVVGARR